MAAYWHLHCLTCNAIEPNVACSMYDIPPCAKCGSERFLAPAAGIKKSGIFPYVCNHVDGAPMEIRDMVHLRQIEREYGVAFSAFSNSSVNDTDPMKNVPVYREHVKRQQ